MKTRSFFSVLAAIVLVLLLAGGAGAYWLASNTPYKLLQGVEQSTPEASMFVSRQSPLVVSLLVNPDRLTALELANSPARQRKQIQSQWQKFRQTLLDQNGLNYARDIQPWLGNEITFAVTTSDFDRNLSNGQQSGYLIAAAIQHPEQAKQAIETYWQKQGVKGLNLVFEQYAGVNLIYGTSEEDKAQQPDPERAMAPSLTTAIVGDRFVLFANYPKVMRDAINNLQVPELSLGSSEAYQEALERLSNPHIGAVFVHLPQLATWLGEAELEELGEPSIVPTSPTYDSLVMAIQLDPHGVIGDMLVLTTADQEIEATKPELSAPVPALQYLPANSALAISGKNLPQLWDSLNQGVEGYETLKNLIHQPLNRFQQRWQVEPDAMFGWVQGEYALGCLTDLHSAQPDWILVAERSPAAQDDITQDDITQDGITQDDITKLDELAQARGTSVSTFTVADQPVTAWTKLSTVSRNPSGSRQRQSLTIQATVEGVHTTIGNYEIFATSLDAIAQAIQASGDSPSNDSLLNTEKFQQAITPLPFPNSGSLYVDSSVLRTFLEQQLADLPLPLSPLRPFLESLQSVTVSSYGSEKTASRGIIFLQL